MSSSERIERADIIVIGAGIMGASIAFQLAKHSDRKVVVIDERPPVGGASGRTFGQIRQHYSNALMVRLAIRGFDVLNNWQSEVGFGDPGYMRAGYMMIVKEAQVEACQRNIDLGQSLGVDTHFASPSELKEIEPLLETSGLAGGAWEPNGGYIDVIRMVLSWLGASQARGLTLLSGVRVDTITTTGGRVSGVATPEGSIEAPIVVNATGAWATDLLAPIGVDVPIERLRLDMAYMSQRPGRPNIGTCITDGNSNVVLRPDMGRHMLAVAYSGALPKVEDPLGDAPATDHEGHLARIDTAFAERLPECRGAKVERLMSGAYDVTPDYHPILGWAPELEGLYLAVGFSGHGLKLSPAIGEVVADSLLGREPAFDISPLRPTRFADGEPMYLAYGPSARA